MSKNTSQTGRVVNMNYRFWGGWFLVVTILVISMAIGCDNTLGVKTATVTGQIVDSDTLEPIAGGLVRMLGKEAAETGAALSQINTFLSTLTDANGYFVFEDVTPDNVVFQIEAPGYHTTTFPQSTSTSSSEDDDSGTSSETSGDTDIEYVSVLSGQHVDLHQIRMVRTSEAPSHKVTVRIDLYDSATKKPIDPADGYDFTVILDSNSFTNQKVTKLKYDGIQINSGKGLSLAIQNTDGIYAEFKQEIDVLGDLYYRAEIDPIGFNLVVRAVNVPDYVGSYPINLFIERIDESPVAMTVATGAIDFPKDDGKTFFNVPISNIKDGFQFRAQLHGYDDMVALVEPGVLANSNNETRRIDIDFSKEDSRTSLKRFGSGDVWEIGAQSYIKYKHAWIEIMPVVGLPSSLSTSLANLQANGLSFSCSLPYKEYSDPCSVGDNVAVVRLDMAAGYEGIVYGRYGTKVGTTTVYVNTYTANENHYFSFLINLVDPNETPSD